ncbi:hypothetical protein N658DRAFT_37063 [Parathielavia hyrcaniae]|uniref:Uncharacterized protein n=1 Tax=Parathielavia hyrcaniae TaxID=113614 RepID=A0AAN6QGV1_9PEZI|nr:hypothetical protein N658DRAFT_37063 [Parathielavia hyrcaniae]
MKSLGKMNTSVFYLRMNRGYRTRYGPRGQGPLVRYEYENDRGGSAHGERLKIGKVKLGECVSSAQRTPAGEPKGGSQFCLHLQTGGLILHSRASVCLGSQLPTHPVQVESRHLHPQASGEQTWLCDAASSSQHLRLRSIAESKTHSPSSDPDIVSRPATPRTAHRRV